MSALPSRAPAGIDDYPPFCEGLRALCGIDLAQYKRRQMERRIRGFALKSGHQGLASYLKLLSGQPAALEAFLDHITINVSQLWRNPEHWETLARDVLAPLGRAGRIQAWSAGSSYGAEAYTLAAVSRALAPRARIEITGTDIDPRMVARARQGVFSEEDARTAPRRALEDGFERTPEGWRARPELRSLVRFEIGDLLRMPVRRARFDLVLCRNTVIYFEGEVRDALHARLAEALRPGGHLMIGATERISDVSKLGLTPAGPFLYRRS